MHAPKFWYTFLCAPLCASLVACATREPPVAQTIRVQTPGCAAARCELSNDAGRWQLARTPGRLAVTVSQQPLRVTCRGDEASSFGNGLASSYRPATSGTGALTGAAVGGAAVGVGLGATALAFIPPLGVIALLGGAGASAVAGEFADSRSRPLRYPVVVSIPMTCPGAESMATALSASRLGLGIRGLAATEAQAAGLDGRTAVIVTSAVEGGRAAASGLRSGDVILAADGEDMFDAADLEEHVTAAMREAPLALRLWRDRQVRDVLVTRDPKVVP